MLKGQNQASTYTISKMNDCVTAIIDAFDNELSQFKTHTVSVLSHLHASKFCQKHYFIFKIKS